MKKIIFIILFIYLPIISFSQILSCDVNSNFSRLLLNGVDVIYTKNIININISTYIGIKGNASKYNYETQPIYNNNDKLWKSSIYTEGGLYPSASIILSSNNTISPIIGVSMLYCSKNHYTRESTEYEYDVDKLSTFTTSKGVIELKSKEYYTSLCIPIGLSIKIAGDDDVSVKFYAVYNKRILNYYSNIEIGFIIPIKNFN